MTPTTTSRHLPVCAVFLAAASALLLAVRPLPAAEPTSAELLDALQTVLTQEAAANAAAETGGRSGGESSPIPVFFTWLRRAREALTRGNEREAIQIIEDYVIVYNKSIGVQKAGSDLLARLQVERAARDAATVTEVGEAITRAEEAAAQAKTARDMDSVLATLGKFRERFNNSNGIQTEERQRIANRLHTVLTTLRGWQDYLAALDADRLPAARNALQNLISNEGGPTFLPRSELLVRMQALPDPNARPPIPIPPEPTPKPRGVPLQGLLARLKTLDDIPPVLRELAEHEAQYRGESPFAGSFLPGELDRLNRAHVLFQGGMPFSLDLMDRSTGNAGAYTAIVAPLRAAFVRLALPRALGLPENTVIPAEESVNAFLRRNLEEAKTVGKWALVARILEANRRLGESAAPSNSTTFNGESRGLESFLAGRNQEEAGQWALAVGSYQTALRSGSPDLPVREIGERLERIGREHPEGFRAGMEQFLNPPERRDGYPPFGRSGGYPGYNGTFPGMSPPGAAGPTPPPTLPVPAIAPSPSPTNSPKPTPPGAGGTPSP